MKSLFMRFIHDRSGITPIEYGVITLLGTLVIVALALSVGNKVATAYGVISGALDPAAGKVPKRLTFY